MKNFHQYFFKCRLFYYTKNHLVNYYAGVYYLLFIIKKRYSSSFINYSEIHSKLFVKMDLWYDESFLPMKMADLLNYFYGWRQNSSNSSIEYNFHLKSQKYC